MIKYFVFYDSTDGAGFEKFNNMEDLNEFLNEMLDDPETIYTLGDCSLA